MPDVKVPPFPLDTPLPFYGVDNQRFKLGTIVYEVLEDPDDGYRSYLGNIEVREEAPGIFFPNPVDTVRAVTFSEKEQYADGATEGFRLVSVTDGHVWLEFGTDGGDMYYPGFVWRYTPRT